MKTSSNRRKLAAVVLPFALLIAACGSDSEDSSSESPTTAAQSGTETTVDQGGTETTAPSDSESDMPAPEGEACSMVPEDGAGSVQGMAQDPVATAAGNNPLLSTLVDAVTAAELGDTLNTTDNITVFAPINSAFADVPEDALNDLLADKAQLTEVLSHHVIPERLEIDDIAGEHETLQGDMVTIGGDSPAFTVDADTDASAKVVCAGVQTANATVYLIDSVLMPTG